MHGHLGSGIKHRGQATLDKRQQRWCVTNIWSPLAWCTCTQWRVCGLYHPPLLVGWQAGSVCVCTRRGNELSGEQGQHHRTIYAPFKPPSPTRDLEIHGQHRYRRGQLGQRKRDMHVLLMRQAQLLQPGRLLVHNEHHRCITFCVFLLARFDGSTYEGAREVVSSAQNKYPRTDIPAHRHTSCAASSPL